MKAASSAALAILAAGQYLRFNFYKMVLPTAGNFFFHDADSGGPIIPLAANTPSSVQGTYLPGLTITRSAFTQKLGLEVQSVDLTIAPQADNPGGPVTIGGAGFLSQVRAGAFDGAKITVSKAFFPLPIAGRQLDVSAGIIPWYSGVVDEVQCGRFSVDITLNETVQLLNVQMPRNVLQPGCVHEVFDAGCTLLASTFTVTGATVSGGITANGINTSLTQVNNYWQRGILTWTSGPMSGSQYVVSAYVAASGKITTIVPFAATPVVGNTFSIRPNCLKTQAACSNASTSVGPAYNNIGHYRGAPNVPQPETLYDGGTPQGTAPTVGGQGGQGAGSPYGGIVGRGTYQP